MSSIIVFTCFYSYSPVPTVQNVNFIKESPNIVATSIRLVNSAIVSKFLPPFKHHLVISRHWFHLLQHSNKNSGAFVKRNRTAAMSDWKIWFCFIKLFRQLFDQQFKRTEEINYLMIYQLVGRSTERNVDSFQLLASLWWTYGSEESFRSSFAWSWFRGGFAVHRPTSLQVTSISSKRLASPNR